MPLSLGKEVRVTGTWLWQAAFGLNLILQSPRSAWAQVQLARSPWGQALYYPTKRPKETENSLSLHTHKKF